MAKLTDKQKIFANGTNFAKVVTKSFMKPVLDKESNYTGEVKEVSIKLNIVEP